MGLQRMREIFLDSTGGGGVALRRTYLKEVSRVTFFEYYIYIYIYDIGIYIP